MASTNQTPHYALPQYVATDKPTILGDINDAFSKIDAQMYLNATSSSSASADSANALSLAQQASTDAADAKTNVATAQSTADEAKTTAESASTTASTANDNATKALSTAENNTKVLGDVEDTAKDAIKLSTNICDKYSVETAYNVGDYVIYEGKLYKCNTATTAGAFIPANWTAITTMGEMKRNKVTVDTALSATSTNPVTNKAVTEAIQNAGSSVTVDSALSSTSENPVQNKAIVTALAGKQDVLTIDSAISSSSTNPVQNKAIYTALEGKQNTLTAGDNISLNDNKISFAQSITFIPPRGWDYDDNTLLNAVGTKSYISNHRLTLNSYTVTLDKPITFIKDIQVTSHLITEDALFSSIDSSTTSSNLLINYDKTIGPDGGAFIPVSIELLAAGTEYGKITELRFYPISLYNGIHNKWWEIKSALGGVYMMNQLDTISTSSLSTYPKAKITAYVEPTID